MCVQEKSEVFAKRDLDEESRRFFGAIFILKIGRTSPLNRKGILLDYWFHAIQDKLNGSPTFYF